MPKIDNHINDLINVKIESFIELMPSVGDYSLEEIKKQLMREIRLWIELSKLKQIEAAKLLSITRPRVSDLVNGKISKFTIDALINILGKTGRTVSVTVSNIQNIHLTTNK